MKHFEAILPYSTFSEKLEPTTTDNDEYMLVANCELSNHGEEHIEHAFTLLERDYRGSVRKNPIRNALRLRKKRRKSPPPDAIERKYACMEQGCRWTFDTPAKLRRHETTHKATGTLSCQLCNTLFSYTYNIYYHWRTICPKMIRVRTFDELNTADPETLRGYVLSLMSSENREGEFHEFGGILFTPSDEFIDDVLNDSDKISRRECHICSISVPTIFFEYHSDSHRAVSRVDSDAFGKYFCNICAKLFYSQSDLYIHWRRDCKEISGRSNLKCLTTEELTALVFLVLQEVAPIGNINAFQKSYIHRVVTDAKNDIANNPSHPPQSCYHHFTRNTWPLPEKGKNNPFRFSEPIFDSNGKPKYERSFVKTGKRVNLMAANSPNFYRRTQIWRDYIDPDNGKLIKRVLTFRSDHCIMSEYKITDKVVEVFESEQRDPTLEIKEFDLQCDKCKMKFSSEHRRSQHEIIVHKTINLFCHLCKQSFKKREALEKHWATMCEFIKILFSPRERSNFIIEITEEMVINLARTHLIASILKHRKEFQVIKTLVVNPFYTLGDHFKLMLESRTADDCYMVSSDVETSYPLNTRQAELFARFPEKIMPCPFCKLGFGIKPLYFHLIEEHSANPEMGDKIANIIYESFEDNSYLTFEAMHSILLPEVDIEDVYIEALRNEIRKQSDMMVKNMLKEKAKNIREANALPPYKRNKKFRIKLPQRPPEPSLLTGMSKLSIEPRATIGNHLTGSELARSNVPLKGITQSALRANQLTLSQKGMARLKYNIPRPLPPVNSRPPLVNSRPPLPPVNSRPPLPKIPQSGVYVPPPNMPHTSQWDHASRPSVPPTVAKPRIMQKYVIKHKLNGQDVVVKPLTKDAASSRIVLFNEPHIINSNNRGAQSGGIVKFQRRPIISRKVDKLENVMKKGQQEMKMKSFDGPYKAYLMKRPRNAKELREFFEPLSRQFFSNPETDEVNYDCGLVSIVDFLVGNNPERQKKRQTKVASNSVLQMCNYATDGSEGYDKLYNNLYSVKMLNELKNAGYCPIERETEIVYSLERKVKYEDVPVCDDLPLIEMPNEDDLDLEFDERKIIPLISEFEIDRTSIWDDDYKRKSKFNPILYQYSSEDSEEEMRIAAQKEDDRNNYLMFLQYMNDKYDCDLMRDVFYTKTGTRFVGGFLMDRIFTYDICEDICDRLGKSLKIGSTIKFNVDYANKKFTINLFLTLADTSEGQCYPVCWPCFDSQIIHDGKILKFRVERCYHSHFDGKSNSNFGLIDNITINL